MWKRDFLTIKTRQREVQPKYVHAHKEVPTGQQYGGSCHTFFGKSERLSASLKCLYINTCNRGSKQEELEVCV